MQIVTSKKDIVWNYFGVFTAMGSNFVMLPFLIKFLDGDTLGLWYVFLSVGAIVVLFDFGFNPSLARNVAYCWSGAKDLKKNGVCCEKTNEPNYKLLSNLLVTCRRLYLAIASAAFLILLIGGTPYILSISKNLDQKEVLISWSIYAVSVCFNLFYGYYSTFLRGVGAVDIYNKINVVSRWIQIFVVIMCLYCGYGIISIVSSYFLYGLLLRLLSKRNFYFVVDKRYILKNKFNNVEILNTLKKIWPNAWKDGVIAISTYCSTQAGVFLSSKFFTLEETGYYSISVQIATALATISAAYYSAYQPAMQSAYANNDVNSLKKMMSFSMLIYSMLYLFGLGIVVFCVYPLIPLLDPSFKLNILVLFSVSIFVFFYKKQSYYASFISNMNSIPYVLAYFLSGVFGVLLAFILLKFFGMGPLGLVAGLMIAQLYNCVKWPLYVRKMLHESFFSFHALGWKTLHGKIRKNYENTCS